MNVATYSAFKQELEKLSKMDWHKFREGLVDEGIPLTGATLGAAIGGKYGKGLTGAALGYAAGGGASLLRSKLKGETPSASRAMLAGGALGYGLGGLGHAGLSAAFKNSRKAGAMGAIGRGLHQEGRFLHGALEEGLPAIGATLGTATAMGMHKDKPEPQTANRPHPTKHFIGGQHVATAPTMAKVSYAESALWFATL